MNNRYVIGTPGKPPRMHVQCNEATAIMQCQEGEVYFLEPPINIPNPIFISDDGTTLVTGKFDATELRRKLPFVLFEIRRQKLEQEFEYDFGSLGKHILQSRPGDIDNLLKVQAQALASLALNEDEPIILRTKDNDHLEVSPTLAIQAIRTLFKRNSAISLKISSEKDRIGAMTDQQVVEYDTDSIDFTTIAGL